jgi:hypothetical protein
LINKASYENFWKTLLSLKEHCTKLQVKNLSMPVIGCGLDRLDWKIVKHLIQKAFDNTNINIKVYIWKEE